jgi:hypothetical protein
MTDGGSDRHFTGYGEFDFDRQVGTIRLQTPENSPLEEISTATVLYLRRAGANTKWRWVDATRLPDGNLISAGYTSPVFDFALLRGAGTGTGTVHYVGPDNVRGTPVSRYSGTLDLISSAQDAENPIKGELLAAAHSFSQDVIPFDAYIDSQGKVRRVVADFSFPARSPAKGQVRISATTDLLDLDQPVTVITPPARDLSATPPRAPDAH